jgi:Holliday junction resolvase-like predicted endonuclease
MTTYHVAVAAEAYAAAAFARGGYEVSVQYGANQPGYDLVAVKANRVLKISVKGSQDGGWALLAKYKKGRTWVQAVDAWLLNQPDGVVMLFVQFRDKAFHEMPHLYLARAQEVAAHLKKGRDGHVSTCLLEKYVYKKGVGKGFTDLIPESWVCSLERMDQV